MPEEEILEEEEEEEEEEEDPDVVDEDVTEDVQRIATIITIEQTEN